MQPCLTQWLDRLDATGRWALLKFLGGAARVGVSARLAKQAVADAFGRKDVDRDRGNVARLEAPLTSEFFAWLEDKAERPQASRQRPIFRPLMLAHGAGGRADWQALELRTIAAEWKWDGIRIQVARRAAVTAAVLAQRRRHLRPSFPELDTDHFEFDAVLDGELAGGARRDHTGTLRGFAAAAEPQDRDGQARCCEQISRSCALL
jgi:DNA ligase-1